MIANLIPNHWYEFIPRPVQDYLPLVLPTVSLTMGKYTDNTLVDPILHDISSKERTQRHMLSLESTARTSARQIILTTTRIALAALFLYYAPVTKIALAGAFILSTPTTLLVGSLASMGYGAYLLYTAIAIKSLSMAAIGIVALCGGYLLNKYHDVFPIVGIFDLFLYNSHKIFPKGILDSKVISPIANYIFDPSIVVP